MSTNDMPHVTITQPAEVALVIAYMLGYWPGNALVALAVMRERPCVRARIGQGASDVSVTCASPPGTAALDQLGKAVLPEAAVLSKTVGDRSNKVGEPPNTGEPESRSHRARRFSGEPPNAGELLNASDEFSAAGPLMNFHIPPLESRARATAREPPLSGQAIAAQLREFVCTFRVKTLALAWFCEDLEQEIRLLGQLEELIAAVAQMSAARSRESTLVNVVFTVVDREHWLDVGAFCEASFKRETVRVPHRAVRPISEVLASQVGIALNVRALGSARPDFPEVISARAQAVAAQAWGRGMHRAYREMLLKGMGNTQEFTVTRWNRVLRVLLNNQDRVLLNNQDKLGGRDRRDSEEILWGAVVGGAQRAGILLAQLNNQNIRDRVILFAVAPTVNSMAGIRDRQLVRLMSEASRVAPNFRRIRRVIGLLTFLTELAPHDGAQGLATTAYLYWWLGSGSMAGKVAQSALDRDRECSMAHLVRYAVQVHLPPPWVEV
ncbi:MAG: hypothetical protein MR006_07635 [Arcanobacterium sp.]|nr:hypothetical protein [Arcanobacterium sp.]MDY5589356.1 hypothetical protein [Arcanobacterium sp.]